MTKAPVVDELPAALALVVLDVVLDWRNIGTVVVSGSGDEVLIVVYWDVNSAMFKVKM